MRPCSFKAQLTLPRQEGAKTGLGRMFIEASLKSIYKLNHQQSSIKCDQFSYAANCNVAKMLEVLLLHSEVVILKALDEY